MKGNDNQIQYLRSMPLFSDLPEKEREGLLSNVRITSYPKNHHLFHQGDLADKFFIIINGWVKIFRQTAEGEEAIISLLTQGDSFGEAAIFNGSIYPFSAQVNEAAEIADIPARVLKEHAQAEPLVASKIMHLLASDIKRTQLENEHLAVMTAPQRVGCLLLQLSGNMIGKGGTFSFPYDKSIAAAQLGMKPETFSRALSQLKPYGVTVEGPEVKIDSFACLIGFCCGHCSAAPGECRGSHTESCNGTACSGACRGSIAGTR